MKFYLLLAFVLTTQLFNAQTRMEATFGEPTDTEKLMEFYLKDPSAPAVVLFESGNYKVEPINGQLRLVETIHRKIKVFDASKFDDDVVTIYLYKSRNNDERVKNIKAVTHNGIQVKYLAKDQVFDVDVSEKYAAKRFTFPDIQDGSIIEYTYRRETPFFFSLEGWVFQKDIPVIYSEMYTEIPGNYIYNKSIYGQKTLDIKEGTIKKNCFSLPGYSQSADCIVGLYAMRDIPAFKSEDYMLAKSNYLSRIDYELREYTNLVGEKTKFSKTWKDVDKEFKTDKDLGRQLNSKSFFKSNVPQNIISIKDPLERAKEVYNFIKNKMSWNEKYRVFSEIRVKKAFEDGVGNTAEINIALVNALKVAGLDAKIALASTRKNGLPSQEYPVITDFNYVLAHLKIGNSSYFLDATRKHTTFDILPYEVLNLYARVMDFKEGSYWQDIKPYAKNVHYVNAVIEPNEDGKLATHISDIKTGYLSVNEKEKIYEEGSENYLKRKLNGYSSSEVLDYKIENEEQDRIEISCDLLSEEEFVGDKLYLNPFLFETFFKKNPFQLDKRSYPIDFGHPITNTYLINIDLKNKYSLEFLPENRLMKLPNNLGECSMIYAEKDGKISARMNFKLNESVMTASSYNALKEFFNVLIEIQTKETIILNKV